MPVVVYAEVLSWRTLGHYSSSYPAACIEEGSGLPPVISSKKCELSNSPKGRWTIKYLKSEQTHGRGESAASLERAACHSGNEAPSIPPHTPGQQAQLSQGAPRWPSRCPCPLSLQRPDVEPMTLNGETGRRTKTKSRVDKDIKNNSSQQSLKKKFLFKNFGFGWCLGGSVG